MSGGIMLHIFDVSAIKNFFNVMTNSENNTDSYTSENV